MKVIVKVIMRVVFIAAIGAVAVWNANQLFGNLNIPAEPGQDKVLMRYMKLQLRAFIIVYDLNGDGIGDYMTQRNISSNYTTIGEHPIYYGIDLNGNGKLDKATEVFIDPQQDGLNGNEMSLVEWEEAQENVES